MHTCSVLHPKCWPNWFRTLHHATTNGAVLPLFKQATVFQTHARMKWAAGIAALHRDKLPRFKAAHSTAGNHSLLRSCQRTSPYVWARKGLPSNLELKALQELTVNSRVPHTNRLGRHPYLQVHNKATAHKGTRLYKFFSSVPTCVQGSRSDLLLNSELLSHNPSPLVFSLPLQEPTVL